MSYARRAGFATSAVSDCSLGAPVLVPGPGCSLVSWELDRVQRPRTPVLSQRDTTLPAMASGLWVPLLWHQAPQHFPCTQFLGCSRGFSQLSAFGGLWGATCPLILRKHMFSVGFVLLSNRSIFRGRVVGIKTFPPPAPQFLPHSPWNM